MPCPRCRVDLLMTDRQGIEIDYCPKCRGVWLDRGELDKVIERSAQFAPPVDPLAGPAASPWTSNPPPAGQSGWTAPHDSYRSGHHGGSKGHSSRSSFLGRLFDH
ncbi:MAG: zf-TFIIB domain-containing protein [Rhodospirillales bacterium]|nr:zf-TFIIB domain-containing protein [Rhodospirillales bacterium]MBN8929928.1 zf-TFIIB domain-containing protein [Rhodospirillales bacterium]